MIDMKIGVEMYIRFSLDQREFRCFAPLPLKTLVDTVDITSVTVRRNLQLVQLADIVINLGNETLVKNRDPDLELTPELMNHVKSIPLSDYEDVVEHGEQQFKSAIIGEFKDEYRFLSNFYPATFVYQHIIWPNSEAAYQAMKSNDREVHLEFALLFNPAQAKRAGRLIDPMREDWDDVKVGIMRDIVSEKFNQNPELKEKLLATGWSVLQEGNLHNDRIWGVCPPHSDHGENLLGKILMDIRRDFRTVSF